MNKVRRFGVLMLLALVAILGVAFMAAHNWQIITYAP